MVMPTSDQVKAAIMEQLTVPAWPYAGMALGLSRNSTYEAARRGDFPTIKIKGSIRVPTAPFRKMLGIEPSPPAGAPVAQRAA